jgi:hypothetical protein
MPVQNPFEIIIDQLNAIQTKVGDIDTIVRSGNLPPIRKERKSPKNLNANRVKEKESKGGRDEK